MQYCKGGEIAYKATMGKTEAGNKKRSYKTPSYANE